jgi:hypothetical protein
MELVVQDEWSDAHARCGFGGDQRYARIGRAEVVIGSGCMLGGPVDSCACLAVSHRYRKIL